MIEPRLILSQRLRRHHAAAEARRREPAPDAASLSAAQLDRIRAIWSDAIVDVPYYAKLVADRQAPAAIGSWRDVTSLPVLTRQILQEQPAAFIRRSGPAQGITKTAGSTGTPIQFGTNQSERDLMRIVKLAAWQDLGYKPDSRLFLLWGHSHLLGDNMSRVINTARRTMADRLLGYRRVNAYRLNPEICADYAEQLIAHRPIGFIGYASALDLFGRYTREYRERFRALGLGFVLATSEPPPRPDTISMLEDLFNCPVVQEYGGAEFGQVAFKKGAAPFEVYGDLNFVETASTEADQDAPPVLLTALYQRYVPLIRYRVGDAITGAQVLPYGHVASFTGVAGRINDVVQLSGGLAIHSVSIHHCFVGEASVLNVQMTLRDDGIVLRLIAPAADRETLEARVRTRLNKLHPDLGAARFEYAEDLATSRAGKRRWFIDERSAPPCAVSPAS
jgi:phenylacetate-coenzyme A ligase PaaK-like adenylate-forming protein